MTTSIRPYVTSGIAIVGASVLLVSPMGAAPSPPLHAPHVAQAPPSPPLVHIPGILLLASVGGGGGTTGGGGGTTTGGGGTGTITGSAAGDIALGITAAVALGAAIVVLAPAAAAFATAAAAELAGAAVIAGADAVIAVGIDVGAAIADGVLLTGISSYSAATGLAVGLGAITTIGSALVATAGGDLAGAIASVITSPFVGGSTFNELQGVAAIVAAAQAGGRTLLSTAINAFSTAEANLAAQGANFTAGALEAVNAAESALRAGAALAGLTVNAASAIIQALLPGPRVFGKPPPDPNKPQVTTLATPQMTTVPSATAKLVAVTNTPAVTPKVTSTATPSVTPPVTPTVTPTVIPAVTPAVTPKVTPAVVLTHTLFKVVGSLFKAVHTHTDTTKPAGVGHRGK